MALRNLIRYRELYIFLLFATFSSVANSEQSDWIMEMEDAFAPETKQSGMMCKRNPTDKWMFCRYQHDERISLSKLNPCLCTHIVFNTALFHPVPTTLTNLRVAYAQIQVLASVTVNKEDLQNSSKLIDWLDKQLLNGVDLRMEEKDYLEDITWSKFLKYIQKISVSFKEKENKQTLIVTITSDVLLQMRDSQFLELSSYVDFISNLPEPLESKRKDMVQKLSRVEKLGNVKKKLLTEISLRNSLEDVMEKTLTNERYPELCKYLNFRKDEHTAANISLPLPERYNLLETIKKKVQFGGQSEISGIDIWSLNDDDSHGACGEKPFPIISTISAVLKGGRKVFDSFADLDIVLSTGESQLDEIEVLHEPDTDPEEIRKFKCDRIGFYRHPSDCTKFYHCAEHRPTSAQASTQHAVFVYKCPSGLVYDELQESCNWPSYSEPCQGSDELLPVPPKKFQCTIPGFHVDPEDCRWFYYCSDLGDGRLAAFEFLCPSHLLGFDEQQLLCNWKWMVPTCSNSPSIEPEKENTAHTLNDGRNVNGISINRILKISQSSTTSVPSSYTYPNTEIFNVSLALNLQSENLNAHVRNRSDVKSFFTEDLLKGISPTYNSTESLEKSIKDETNFQTPLSVVENTTEKKYGTAFWHRSMVNNKLPTDQRNRFDFFLERINNLKIRNNNSDTSVNLQQNSDIKIDHKYGIGTVRKISMDSRPKQNNGIKDSISAIHQGRSLGDIVATSYHFENTLNDHDSITQQNPYSQVKCDKLKNKAGEANGSEDIFGCVGEVSLTIRVKEGKEYDKYVLKPDHIVSSAIQESKHVPVLTNHTIDAITAIPQKLLQVSGSLASQQNLTDISHHFSDIETDKLQNLHTQGRSVSNGRKLNGHPQIYSGSNESKGQNNLYFYPNQPELEVAMEVENQNRHFGTLNKKSSVTNTNYDHLEKEFQPDNGTLVRRPRTKHFEHSIDGTNKMMPLVFFPEGVLLNVDLNQINEIPPQILLEVDNMLKRYMNDGNIDVHLLMKKLNATAETMADTINNDQGTSNEIEYMLDVIENLLNSTDGIYLDHMHNVSLMNNTEKSANETEMITTIENYTDPNDLQLQYENITNYAEIYISKEMENRINSSEDSLSNDLENSSKIPGVRKNILSAEKILEIPDTKPFVRRRLFRKHKFPSIREQLDIQNRLTQSKNLDKSPNYKTTTTSTETSVLISNRQRYPSIRQQLFLNSKRRNSINARNNVIWKRLQEMKFETVPPINNTQDYNTSVRLRHLGDAGIISKPPYSNDNDADSKTRRFNDEQLHLQQNPPKDENTRSRIRHLGDGDISLKTRLLEDGDISIKNRQFGDRIRPNDIDLSFSSNPQTPTIDEHPGHRKPNLENNRDMSFASIPKHNRDFSEKHKIVAIDYGSKTSSENENIPYVSNEYSHRKSLHEDRYHYTFPLAPQLPTDSFPLPPQLPTDTFPLPRQLPTDYPPVFSVSETPTNEGNSLHRGASEPTVKAYPHNTIEGPQRPRKSRKLRILVKKRFPDVYKNDNSPTAHNDASSTDPHHHMRMRIPKKLLSDLRSNVLRKFALDGKSEVKLQIQFQDNVWNVPFVNEKSPVDISPAACTRPGLFQHPKSCNMFYECFWDKWLQKFTLHVFSCPVRLVYDDSVRGCSRPSFQSHCWNSLDNS